MNKRIVLSSLSLISSVALVAGATFAFFSDTETSSGNTFTAGTLDLKVNDHDVVGTLVTLTAKPSEDTQPEIIELKNIGTNGGIADLHFTNVVNTGGTNTEPECIAENGSWTSPNGPCVSPIAVADDVSTQIGVDIGYDLDGNGTVEEDEYLIWTDGGASGDIEPGELAWGDNLDPHNIVATLDELNSESFDLGYLVGAGPGAGPRTLILSFHLDGDTGNQYQGDVSTFDIKFTLHQPNATPNLNIVPSGIPTPTPTP